MHDVPLLLGHGMVAESCFLPDSIYIFGNGLVVAQFTPSLGVQIHGMDRLAVFFRLQSFPVLRTALRGTVFDHCGDKQDRQGQRRQNEKQYIDQFPLYTVIRLLLPDAGRRNDFRLRDFGGNGHLFISNRRNSKRIPQILIPLGNGFVGFRCKLGASQGNSRNQHQCHTTVEPPLLIGQDSQHTRKKKHRQHVSGRGHTEISHGCHPANRQCSIHRIPPEPAQNARQQADRQHRFRCTGAGCGEVEILVALGFFTQTEQRIRQKLRSVQYDRKTDKHKNSPRNQQYGTYLPSLYLRNQRQQRTCKGERNVLQ